MIEIQLTQGQVTLVDDIDADLAEIKWYAAFDPSYGQNGAFIASRKIKINGGQSTERLNRVILSLMLNRSLGINEIVDHKDRNTLNNQRNNLRLATPSQSGANQKRSKNNVTGFKGVSVSRSKYQSNIYLNGKKVYLGTFGDPILAAQMYDIKAKELYGEFAVLNFED